jgi:Ca-activated chloride channel homolog
MTFGSMAAWQAWTLLALAAGAAAALFLVKLRAPRTPAASLLLWRRVLDDRREQSVWERIRRAVSLAATVAIALLLALAVTRPGRASGGAEADGGRLLVVLDSSWSMQALTGTGETRWERAVAEARRVVNGAGMREVALATTADGLVEGPTLDASLIDAALDRLAPGVGERTAFPRLADTAAVHFISDGATARALDPDVIVHSVFSPAPNAAIVAFDVRPSLSQRHAGEAFIEIANFAAEAQTVRLLLTRGAATLFDEPLEIAASSALRQVVPIARGVDALLRARIRASQDALALDDEAIAWVERARPLRVTVVGTDLEWLRAALDGNPDVAARFIDPAAFEAAASAALERQTDAFVFDGWAPAAAPARPALLFAPPSAGWLADAVPAGGPDVPASPQPGVEPRPRWSGPASHRVLLGVDPYTLVIDRAHMYPSGDLTPIARSDRGTPLVLVREAAAPRAVVVAFGPRDSNLPSAPGFPVLLSNAIEWLARPSALAATAGAGTAPPPSPRPGFVDLDPAVRLLTAPGGAPVPVLRAGDRVVGVLRAPGLYTAHGDGFQIALPVNAGDPELSDLTRSTLIGSAQATDVVHGRSGRPWWVYFALAAFVLVTVEWWTWQRRITV